MSLRPRNINHRIRETSTTTTRNHDRSNLLTETSSNDRLGKKVRVKCEPDDTVGDFKKLLAAQIGTAPEKIVLKKWYTTFKDHITLADYEIGNGSSLEL
ncbi:hypothetical protein Dda_6826 [Drechslerella dactyloides]|uniref:Ubiquitin-like modifier HUB1 n=1 Tax=Drechslerella dactyloides TaxID=74499 RepID=A0AAD6NJ92_DREDA|nr:hypothetical protein Dda_6826 [Drechslerella dactyloides]